MAEQTQNVNLEHTPAKMAGGMRVKGPNPHRTPLKAQEHEEDPEKLQKDREDKIDYEERRAQDLQTHTASGNAHIPKNAGNNVRKQINTNETQPRALNH
ncbi:hypothetical protein BY458DRAFT_521236 [Sporodiniella umbellata]|nr:hypothetical protein BY458DRAFT_521236 [Sporodiniella umbellata]